jgi:hypothetical protein
VAIGFTLTPELEDIRLRVRGFGSTRSATGDLPR